MYRTYYLLLLIITSNVFSQSVEDVFSQEKMQKDLSIYKEIRLKANSGLYKYRTKKQIDSIYNWADNKITELSTYRDFYNLICTLNDFEGSLHNDIAMPNRKWQSLREETSGYFPLPIKWIEGRWIINFENGEIPLGAEIVSINDIEISKVILNVYKYYTTDGLNTTGKRIGIRTHFSRYFRLHYGLQEKFKVKYIKQDFNAPDSIILSSVGYKKYYKRFNTRYSRPFDQIYYENLEDDKIYNFKKIDSLTGILTVHSFSLGGKNSKRHKKYVTFLNSIFSKIKKDKLKNIIVDVRLNGGGQDPNDLVTYSYLTQRNFQENKKAWITFNKIPLVKYYNTKVPRFLRPLFVGKYSKDFQKIFTIEKDGNFYQGDNSEDHRVRKPNKNAFKGEIYLLISPAIASAGSLFAAMVNANKNTITIGEETMGGYYGHNGHSPLDYKLPNSKIETQFSVVNLEQDVPEKANQLYNRGIIPDYNIPQTFEDFINHEDTQLNFTLKLIEENQNTKKQQ